MEQKRGTSDTLFLAITRMACVYGVPVAGFSVVLTVSGVAFLLLGKVDDLWRRALVCGVFLIGSIVWMRIITGREPKWFTIAVAWCQTRMRYLWRRPTRVFGGTTFRPWPVSAGRDLAELRDYAG